MNISYDCLPCMVKSILRLFRAGLIPESRQEETIRIVLRELSEANLAQSPPAIARHLQRRIRESLGNADPYFDIKSRYNAMMLARLDGFRELVNGSENPFDTAMRLAVAGNVIDFGAKQLLNVDETIRRVIDAELAIDDSSEMKKHLEKADTVLYIGDNAGEIVMDRLFIETIRHPNLTFVVRGHPVLNDVVLEDARQVGLDQLAPVITTGDDAPGVILATSSPEFRTAFEQADVVISKGQGNLEGLMDVSREVYFLFVAKCGYIADKVNAKEKDFIVWKKPSRIDAIRRDS